MDWLNLKTVVELKMQNLRTQRVECGKHMTDLTSFFSKRLQKHSQKSVKLVIIMRRNFSEIKL